MNIESEALADAVRLLCSDVHPTYVMGSCSLCVRAVGSLHARGLLSITPRVDGAALAQRITSLCDEWDAAIEPDGGTSFAPVRAMSDELRALVTATVKDTA